jgi:uncharacterized protein YqeY
MATDAGSLKARIQDDMKVAMRAQEKARLATIRLILAAVKQKEVDERIELTDTDVAGVLNKMLKQRRESITQYEQAGRADLAQKEAEEISVIQHYLPEALSETELTQLIVAAIDETGAASLKDMGAVMNVLRPKIVGRCDVAEVSKSVKARLSG